MNDFFAILKLKNEPLHYFSLFCLIFAILCLAWTQISDTQVAGTNAWWKPFKFFLSTTLLLWAMAWYMQDLANTAAVKYYSWGMIALFTFENIYIMIQASRGDLSHFNLRTPFFSAMYVLMALASATISLWTAFIGVLFFTEKMEQLSESYLWSIRLGIILFVLFSLQGFAMGSRLSHTVGGADGSAGLPVVNWSKKYGDLRIAHFMGMHALQIIPFVAYHFLKNTVLVFSFALVYGFVTVFLFYQALQGKPFVK
jgi:hypothetical protein